MVLRELLRALVEALLTVEDVAREAQHGLEVVPLGQELEQALDLRHGRLLQLRRAGEVRMQACQIDGGIHPACRVELPWKDERVRARLLRADRSLRDDEAQGEAARELRSVFRA